MAAREREAKRYAVTYERDEAGWWVASITDVPGCHTQGRTFAQTRSRIAEALELAVGDISTAVLIDSFKPPAVERRVRKAREASALVARAQESVRDAARSLTRELKTSVRDAGDILGLSHQRIQQLLEKESMTGSELARLRYKKVIVEPAIKRRSRAVSWGSGQDVWQIGSVSANGETIDLSSFESPRTTLRIPKANIVAFKPSPQSLYRDHDPRRERLDIDGVLRLRRSHRA